MFNKYYMFNEEIDLKLKELGFVLKQDGHYLKYENICQVGSMIIKYEIYEDEVSAQRLFMSRGIESLCYCNQLENKNFEEIKYRLGNSLDDLINNYSIKVKIKEVVNMSDELKLCNDEIYRIDMNDLTLNKIKNNLSEPKDKKEFGFTKVFTGTPVYANDELEDNECKIYY